MTASRSSGALSRAWRDRLKNADVDGTSLSGTPPSTAIESGTKICESPMPLMIKHAMNVPNCDSGVVTPAFR